MRDGDVKVRHTCSFWSHHKISTKYAAPATLRLLPIREADTEIGYPAVMASRERLWEIFGPARDIDWQDWLALPPASS